MYIYIFLCTSPPVRVYVFLLWIGMSGKYKTTVLAILSPLQAQTQPTGDDNKPEKETSQHINLKCCY